MPTSSSTVAQPTPFALHASMSSGVKWSPAVGAAAECSSRMAKTVWYFSGSPSYSVM